MTWGGQWSSSTWQGEDQTESAVDSGRGRGDDDAPGQEEQVDLSGKPSSGRPKSKRDRKMDERARRAAERSGGTFLTKEEHGVWRFVSASMGAPAPRDPKVLYQMAVVTLANNFGRVTPDVAVSRKTDLLAEVMRVEKPDGTVVYRLESDLTITLAVEVSEAEYKRIGLGGMVKEAVRAVQALERALCPRGGKFGCTFCPGPGPEREGP